MKLLEPLAIGERSAPNRVLFGPHPTNLGRGRAISERHAGYYRQRALGGCGVIVVEEASVDRSDWPYERCPLAEEAGEGWAAIATACAETDALVLAGLGHAGGQGSSAYSQRELWAPSDEPEVNSNEVPKIMEDDDIATVVDGFRTASAAAVRSGLAGVELNAGQHSLIRQFLSGLTNRRDDPYGHDRLRFAREALEAARDGLGAGPVLGLRLSCDELAPWAGLTPDSAAEVAIELAPLVDYVVVVRGSIFTVAETRPTGHHGTGFNLDLTAGIRSALEAAVPVFAQGSIVDPDQAEAALAAGGCDGVEMTRAQIADPDLVATLQAGGRARPCVLCNQRCTVRDNRNPIVSCIAEPSAGFETIDEPVPDVGSNGRGQSRPVLIVGGGPAGLEAARIAARARDRVTLIDGNEQAGGLLRLVARAPGHERFATLADWLVQDATDAGVTFRLGELATPDVVEAWAGPVVLATGARPGATETAIDGAARVIAPLEVLAAATTGPDDRLDDVVPATVAIWDPVGNSVGVGVAELLAARGRSVTYLTPDPIVGTLLSLTGDLAGSNVRLQQAGVRIERRQRLVGIRPTSITIEHVFTNERTEVAVDAVVDCAGRLPQDELWSATGGCNERVGDAVAARTVGEAIREGRAAGLRLAKAVR